MPRTTETRTISLEKPLLKKGLRNARQRGFGKSFSAYLGKLIDDDNRLLKEQDLQNGKAVPA